MSKWQQLTIGILITNFSVLTLYDIVVYIKGGRDATISWQMWEAGLHWPFFAFAMGFLCGHFFWQMGNN